MSINMLWTPVVIIAAIFFGYMFRSNQVKKSNKRIHVLKSEVTIGREEISKLHEELSELQRQARPAYKQH